MCPTKRVSDEIIRLREFVYIAMQIIPKSRDSFCRSFLTYFCSEGADFPPNVSL